ncbi:MAG: hypothetical protein KJS92_04055 [Bacteroidetes bacterium]|nr:hypothetical protein [Bacteroidota bacterium]
MVRLKNLIYLHDVAIMGMVFFIAGFISGCNPCGKGYDPRLIARSIACNPSDSSGSWLKGDTVYIKNDTAYFRLELKTDRVVQGGSLSLFPELTACSPTEPYLVEPVDSLSLLATSSWDAAHPEGASLADISFARMYTNSMGRISDTSFHAFAIICKNNNFLLHEAHVCLLKTVCRNSNRINTFVIRLKLRNGAVLQSRDMKIVRV